MTKEELNRRIEIKNKIFSNSATKEELNELEKFEEIMRLDYEEAMLKSIHVDDSDGFPE